MLRALALIMLLPPGVVMADSAECRGDTVEYTTFASTIIPPKVAAAHGITRGVDRLITNVTVLRNKKAIRATVTGTATNLLNQLSHLEFKPVIEQGTVYYLASQRVSERDTIRYHLSVVPSGSEHGCEINFIRDYYRAGN